MYTTTIRELGQKLPIGFLVKGNLCKDFTLRPYKSRIDRHLNAWREANESKSVAHLTAKYLSLIISEAGGKAYTLTDDGGSTADQEFRIHTWNYADVLYAYLYSRIVSIDNWINVSYLCPIVSCGSKGTVKADLYSTEVRVIEKPEEMIHWVKLKKGFKLRDGKACFGLRLRPITFQAQLQVGAGVTDMNAIGYHHFREAVDQVEVYSSGDPKRIDYVLTNKEIDEIEKVDVLVIDRQADKLAAGPDLRTHLECPKCGTKILNALNWSFDHFFDHSVPMGVLMA